MKKVEIPSRYRKINAHTSLYCVIGHPVAHSLGPAIHNHAFSCKGINGAYLAFDVTDLPSAIAGIRAMNIKGVSVTIPHKIAVIDYLDEIDATARDIGAVNTIVNQGGRLKGYNTDVYGAVRAIKEQTEINDRDVIILGAGGAAKAVGFGIKKQGGSVHIVNRTASRGMELASELDARFHPMDKLEQIPCDILINTTSIGMHPDTEAMPVPEKIFKSGMVVMDIVYNPLETKLLSVARIRGCLTIDGLVMFIHQGAMQYQLWTGGEAPVDEMRKIAVEQLKGSSSNAKNH